ncbi:MAG TPA: PAS domain-containing sensor histidine kinase, partial [Microvirga sp.]|nr:PAS domain-containing sensor histidine kinase [Microvirga sp.]
IGGLQQGTPLDVEFRVAGAGGGTRWVRAKGRILREPGESDEDAHVMHGVLSDIEPQKRAEAERLDLLQRLSAAQEAEQRRIALELHDQVGQTVTGLLLGLNALDEMLNDVGNQPARIHVRWLESVASDIGRDIHRAAADLRPTALDDLGLERALVASARDWSDRSTVGVDVQCLGLENRLPTEIETAIYRVVQEALTNVFRHAQARTASVIVERRGSRVSAIVEDDGIGFAIETVEPGQGRSDPVSRARLGLTGIRERLALLGGTLTIESAPGEGTTLFAEIPLPERR